MFALQTQSQKSISLVSSGSQRFSHLLGYTWDNQFFFDTVLAVGLCYAAMACQRSMSAVLWISRQQGCWLFNYLDDFIDVSAPRMATADFQALAKLLSSLGLQESGEKSCLPSPVMICLGVQLDTNNFMLSVSSASMNGNLKQNYA